MAATLIVFASAESGALREFRLFYDEVHIPEVRAAYPEILSACRFDLSPGQSFDSSFAYDSVVLYSVDGSAEALWRRVSTDRSLSTSSSFDYGSVRAVFGDGP